MTVGPDVQKHAPRGAPTRAPRPRSLRIDLGRCIACANCEAFVPGMLDGPDPIPMSASALDAMAACPTGAIVWLERGDSGPNAFDQDS